MPELPEVETVMRGLRVRLLERVIASAVVRRPDLRWPFPKDFAARLTGARITGFRRRAKYILVRLDTGQSLLIHLGMSGRMRLSEADGRPPELHEHVTLETDDGGRAGFVDPRRFGAMDLVATAAEDSHKLLAGLGPEPLEDGFTAKSLIAALAAKRAPVKSVLLDQRVVAGLGNIYVSEALFRARVGPTAAAASLSPAQGKRLFTAIQAVLTEAIEAGGSSLRDYVQPDGELGYFQHAWRVYGKEGQPCANTCPGPPGCAGIARITQGGRSTFFCPRRQGA